MSIESVMLSNYLALWCTLHLFPSIMVFSNELALLIKWLKYWSFSFSISPSNEYWGLISLWEWLVWSRCSPSDSLESSSATHFKSINSSVLSFLYSPALTYIHNYWKNRIFDQYKLYHVDVELNESFRKKNIYHLDELICLNFSKLM